jgi:hypothetical protein
MPVSVVHPHSKLIAQAARDTLRPLGIVQKGRSRTWLDDQGWWIGVIEFQPSSWNRGGYLNVGINWLWNPKDFLSFDLGYRVDEVEPVVYESDEQFTPLAGRLAKAAADRAVLYRTVFPSIVAVAKHAQRPDRRLRKALWAATDRLKKRDAAIACGVVGDVARARKLIAEELELNAAIDPAYRAEWDEQEAKRLVRLDALLDDRPSFRQQILTDIHVARSMLELLPLETSPLEVGV